MIRTSGFVGPRSALIVQRWFAVMTVVVLLISASWTMAQQQSTGDSAAPPAEGTSNDAWGAKSTLSSAAPRLREGTKLVEQLGHFKLTGDGVTFYANDGKARFSGLANLSLERIAAVITDNPDQLEWSVSGVVTEFRGANFLLVTRAILKSKTTAGRGQP